MPDWPEMDKWHHTKRNLLSVYNFICMCFQTSRVEVPKVRATVFMKTRQLQLPHLVPHLFLQESLFCSCFISSPLLPWDPPVTSALPRPSSFCFYANPYFAAASSRPLFLWDPPVTSRPSSFCFYENPYFAASSSHPHLQHLQTRQSVIWRCQRWWRYISRVGVILLCCLRLTAGGRHFSQVKDLPLQYKYTSTGGQFTSQMSNWNGT